MKQEGLSEWGKALWQEYLDENWKALFKDGHGFEVRVLNPISREMEVARYNRDHPEQHTTIKYMSLEDAKKEYPQAKFVMGVDPYATEEPKAEQKFEQFWLETDKFYEMVDESNLDVLQEIYPSHIDYFYARRKVIILDEFEPFAQFGTGPEYTGMTLSQWLSQKGMRHFFNKKEATKIPRVPDDIIELKVFKTVVVTGRGDIIALSLKENGYKDATPKKVHDWFMNKLVTHNNGWYIIHGIEMLGDGTKDYVNDKVGLLIKKWGILHPLTPESQQKLNEHLAKGYPKVDLSFINKDNDTGIQK